MKKLLTGALALLATVTLAACSPKTAETTASSSASSSQVAEQTVTVTIKALDGKSADKTVSFKDGESVLDILKANYDIKEDAGMVTAIDGVEQDAAKNIYWMYTINGEMADKGAGEIQPKAGDTIEFYQQQF